ncbi:MAG: hypothetical protein B6229_09205 [Spirochaetaceae bacterium 4572_7]|nr:MAG: hypothetical protein B6229_09205 [Spirochaetaceae bacterium 4572_7]
MKKIILSLFLLLSFNSYSLNFDTILQNIDNAYDVKKSLLETESLTHELLMYENLGDVTFTLAPSFKANNPEDIDFIENTDITGTLSAKIPVGYSKSELDKISITNDAITISKLNEEKVKLSTLIKLYTQYKELWLLQTEEPVLIQELDASKKYLELLNNKFKTGTANLMDVNKALSTKLEREDSYNQNILKQRLAWFELMSNIALELDPEELTDANLIIKDIPKPAEMYDWLSNSHPLVLIEQIKLTQLKNNDNRLMESDIDLSIKPFYNSPGNDISTSINYSITNKEITPSLSFNVPNSSENWSTGIIMSMSIGSNKTDKLAADTLKSEIKLAEESLKNTIYTLNLGVRSYYQKLRIYKELLEQEKNNVTNAEIYHEVVLTKKDLGQITDYELLESEASLNRAKWKIELAKSQYQYAWLDLLESSALYKKLPLEFK